MSARARLVSSWPALLVLVALGPRLLAEDELSLPRREGSVRFAVIGNSGTGTKEQYRLAELLSGYQEKLRFEFTLMLGGNIKGPVTPAALRERFEDPYEDLLDAAVKFYAVLGNEDDPGERSYRPFGMAGQRFYSFKAPHGRARFFAVDSSYLDPEQLQWLDKELSGGGDADWKICFLSHPLYSSGRKDAGAELRTTLEPLLLKHGVDVVFSGHEHAYARLAPQKGISYFISGGAGARKSSSGASDLVAKRFDTDCHFVLVEIAGDELHFQAIDARGRTVDSGSLTRTARKAPARP